MSAITTHVLDVARGRPAAGVAVRLDRLDPAAGDYLIAQGRTGADGRISTLLPGSAKLLRGQYRLTFDTGAYFESQGVAAFYPCVQVTFRVADPAEHHHVPLLLSPFGYS